MLETCAASAIMYYKEMMLEPGKGRTMATKLVGAAVQSGLASATSHAVQLLRLWSEKIGDDFNMQNNAELLANKCQDPVEVNKMMLAKLSEVQQELKTLRHKINEFWSKSREGGRRGGRGVNGLPRV